MRVRWLRQALANPEHIGEYIAQDNPVAAQATVLEILDAVDALASNTTTNRGRAGRVAGTRELVVLKNYLVPYRIRGEVIEILRVMHARQRWPNRFP